MCQNLSNHTTTECLPRAPKVLRTLDSFCLNFLKLLETCRPRTDCNKLPSRTPRTFAEATVTLPRPSPRRSTRMNHTWPLHISSLARSLARSDRRRVFRFEATVRTSRRLPGRHAVFPDAPLLSRTPRTFPDATGPRDAPWRARRGQQTLCRGGQAPRAPASHPRPPLQQRRARILHQGAHVTRHSAPWPLQRALLTPQANDGSLAAVGAL